MKHKVGNYMNTSHYLRIMYYFLQSDFCKSVPNLSSGCNSVVIFADLNLRDKVYFVDAQFSWKLSPCSRRCAICCVVHRVKRLRFLGKLYFELATKELFQLFRNNSSICFLTLKQGLNCIVFIAPLLKNSLVFHKHSQDRK